MPTGAARTSAAPDNRSRILDVALDVLGEDPQASMADVAAAAGVVRRTVYGHFPSRTDLVLTLTRRAAAELVASLDALDTPDRAADRAWCDFLASTWPLAHRYRLLLGLRRSELSEQIHEELRPVDDALTRLVQRGQDAAVFGQHLPAAALSQLAYATVFTLAERALLDDTIDVGAATTTTLLLLGASPAAAEPTPVQVPPAERSGGLP